MSVVRLIKTALPTAPRLTAGNPTAGNPTAGRARTAGRPATPAAGPEPAVPHAGREPAAPHPATPLPAVAVLAAALLAATLLTAGCGQGSGPGTAGSATAGSGTPTGSAQGSANGSASGSSPAGSAPTGSAATGSGPTGSATGMGGAGRTVLTIVVDDGKGTAKTWHLTCTPTGGDHPDPARACAVLAQHGGTALPPVPTGRMCTQLYGGPQTAHVTGSWQGRAIDVRLSRTDGCQIARWDALVGLLPAPSTGTSVS